MSQGIFVLLNAIIASAVAVLVRWMEQSSGIALSIGLGVFAITCLIQAVLYFRDRVAALEKELDEVEEEQDALTSDMKMVRSLMNDLADSFEQTLRQRNSARAEHPGDGEPSDSYAPDGSEAVLDLAGAADGPLDAAMGIASVRNESPSVLDEVAALDNIASAQQSMGDHENGNSLTAAMAVTASAGAAALDLALEEATPEEHSDDDDADIGDNLEAQLLSKALKEKVEELAAARTEVDVSTDDNKVAPADDEPAESDEQDEPAESADMNEETLESEPEDGDVHSAAQELLEQTAGDAELLDEDAETGAQDAQEEDRPDADMEPVKATLSSRIESAVNRSSSKSKKSDDKGRDEDDFVDVTAELAGKDVAAEIAALEIDADAPSISAETAISDWLNEGLLERAGAEGSDSGDGENPDSPPESADEAPAPDNSSGLPSLDALLDSFGPNVPLKAPAAEAEEVGDAESTDDMMESPEKSKAYVIRPDVLDSLKYAKENNTIDLFLQPVLALPGREIKFFEGYSRIRGPDGEYIMPSRYMKAATDSGVMSEIDNLLLIRCVEIVRTLKKAGRDIGVFCNVSLSSLQDEKFFEEFVEFLRKNKELSESISFELSQNTVQAATQAEWERMRELALLGFSFSMDTVTDWVMDFGLMARRGFKFLKLDAETLKRGMADKGELVRAEDLKENLSNLGISLVVEKIEDEETLQQAIAYGVDYVQGYHLGKPEIIDNIDLGKPD